MSANGLPMLGGYAVTANPGSSWSRTYSDLPSHNLIQLSMNIIPLDSWDYPQDTFTISMDFMSFAGWSIDVYGTTAARVALMTPICGYPAYADYPPNLYPMAVSSQQFICNYDC